MAQNTLSPERLQELREQGIIGVHEIAMEEGDLIVAMDVLTGKKRLLNKSLKESSSSKRLLKG